MALSQEPFSSKRTKPKPLPLPVARSVMMRTCSTRPKGAKVSRSCSTVIDRDMPPTNTSVFISAARCRFTALGDCAPLFAASARALLNSVTPLFLRTTPGASTCPSSPIRMSTDLALRFRLPFFRPGTAPPSESSAGAPSSAAPPSKGAPPAPCASRAPDPLSSGAAVAAGGSSAPPAAASVASAGPSSSFTSFSSFSSFTSSAAAAAPPSTGVSSSSRPSNSLMRSISSTSSSSPSSSRSLDAAFSSAPSSSSSGSSMTPMSSICSHDFSRVTRSAFFPLVSRLRSFNRSRRTSQLYCLNPVTVRGISAVALDCFVDDSSPASALEAVMVCRNPRTLRREARAAGRRRGARRLPVLRTAGPSPRAAPSRAGRVG